MDITGHDYNIQFCVNGSTCENAAPVINTGQPTDGADALPQTIKLNYKYTFNSFVVGNCNRLAHAAAVGAAEQPGKGYNPLFIYSGSGLGKTHLLHAIGHASMASQQNLVYVSTEQFTNEFISSIKEKKTEDFRNKFRNADILLIDDIQFISGKEQTQESFFHTFNDLHNSCKQIVITSDRPPKSLSMLEDRLRSRFEWGLIADIQAPSIETRISILQAKAESQGLNASPDILEFIANHAKSSIRELEGALNRVIAYINLTGKKLSLELVAQILHDTTASKNMECSTINTGLVIQNTEQYFGLPLRTLQGKKRDRQTALARHIAMYIMREDVNCSLNDIGQALGGRDHSTILHGWRKIKSEININETLCHNIMEIRKTLSR